MFCHATTKYDLVFIIKVQGDVSGPGSMVCFLIIHFQFVCVGMRTTFHLGFRLQCSQASWLLVP